MVMHSTIEEESIFLSAFSHLSIEIGHLCPDEFEGGPERIQEHFRRVAPTVAGVCRGEATRTSEAPRISTCFQLDDVPARAGRSPAEVLPDLMRAAAHQGVPIDYLVRRRACTDAGTWQLLRLGLLRTTAAHPRSWDGTFPDDWACLPPMLRLNEGATPFMAERAVSVLGRRFRPTEHALRRTLPGRTLRRIDYVYTD